MANISESAFWAVAENSIRLLIEADELFKRHRPASALSTAVLSIEETGKLVFLNATGICEQRHRLKQWPFILMLFVCANLGRFSHWQQVLKEGLDPISPLSDEQQRDVAAHPEFAEFVRRLRAGELTEKQERIEAFTPGAIAQCERDGTNAAWRPLIEGRLHELRMQATYADIGDAGEILPGPTSVSPETAEALIIGGVFLLAFAIKMILPERMDDFMNSIPHEVSGQRLLMPLIEAVQRNREEKEAQKRLADQGAAA